VLVCVSKHFSLNHYCPNFTANSFLWENIVLKYACIMHLILMFAGGNSLLSIQTTLFYHISLIHLNIFLYTRTEVFKIEI
jgi:hypothetical protein